ILNEINTINCQMSSDTNAWKSKKVMHDILKIAQHILVIDAFRNELTLTFLEAYHNENIQGKLDCVAYTNTVEVGISFEKTDHYDAVIGITNIITPVNVKAFI
ncbi:546_t:CDS:2, partial [Funneliformis geosporum]